MGRPEETQPLPNNHPDFAEWLNSHSAETMATALREYHGGESVVADILHPQTPTKSQVSSNEGR